jgi:transcriptional regulator of aromatic amino acid metabolism
MENKELIAFRNTKPHQDKSALSELWNKYGNIKDIAKHLHISSKLVMLKIREFGLKR